MKLYALAALLELGFSLPEALGKLGVKRLEEAVPEPVRPLVLSQPEDLPLALRLAARLMRERQERLAILEATMAYPRLVLMAGIALAIVLLALVLPAYDVIYTTVGFERHPAEAALVGWSTSPITWGILLGGTALLMLVLSPWPGADRIRMRLPFLGTFLAHQQALLWLQWVDALLRRGAPLPDAVRQAAAILPSRSFRLSLEKAAERLERGSTLQAALEKVASFPRLTALMLGQAERAGLDFGPVEAALERQVERSFRHGIPVLAPLLLMLALAYVVPLILRIVLPVYRLIGDLG